MYTYETSIQNRPPITPDMRALSGLASPYEYPSTHADNFRAQAARAAANYNVEADRLNADYDWAQQSAENAAVSRGLQMLSRERQQQEDARQRRIDALGSFSRGILGGLFS